MSSSILVVGHPNAKEIQFGAQTADDLTQALNLIGEKGYSVVVVGLSENKETYPVLTKFLAQAKKTNSDVQNILVGAGFTPKYLQEIINQFGIFKAIPNFDQQNLQLAVREALEEYELLKQNQAFLELKKDQNIRLSQLTQLLEDKVKARQAYLLEAREKLNQVTQKIEALNRALVAVQKSQNKTEIEGNLNAALKNSLKLTWTKIITRGENTLELISHSNQVRENIFSAPLFRKNELLGHIYFARPLDWAFTSDEDDFLLQVSDAAALSIDRIMTLKETEALKQEWESTFDSITEPVSLIDNNYQIIRANRFFSDKTRLPPEKIVGEKCYKVLFGNSKPCRNCKLGESFELGDMYCADGSSVSFSVDSALVSTAVEKKVYSLLYRDESQEHRIQKQILESSKMAEIGTIGSSIAHEINNPLGGMIAFLQLIRNDLKKDSSYSKDISDMDEAARRCKGIVENLLAFTRLSGKGETSSIPFNELVKVALNIISLQTRGLGIAVKKQNDAPDVMLNVDSNQIVQVLVNIMQNSCEALAERMSQGMRTPAAQIEFKSYLHPEDSKRLVIEITDNGPGISSENLLRVFSPFFTTKEKAKNPGLGLSVSYQIIKEHGGDMEIFSVFGQSTTVVISLPCVH